MVSRAAISGGLIASVLILVLFYAKNTTFFFQNKFFIEPVNVSVNEQGIQVLRMELAQCERKMLLGQRYIRKPALQFITPWLAPILWDGTYDLKILNNQFKDKRIGLFVFAVKKYIRFLPPFLESAERYFMVGYSVNYYVFTDKVGEVQRPKLGNGRILNLLEVEADKRWQDISMKRMQILVNLTNERLRDEIDYLVCADVDMVFNDHVGVEILGNLVATLHPGFFLSEPMHFPYERRPISEAYVPLGQGDFYYMAAFYGGTVQEIYKLSSACCSGISVDKKNNIEALWQEESHLNKYLVYNKPTKVLSPEYIWDTNLPHGDLVKKKRFLAVHKDHEEVRN
ncbi:hypothetical protein GDO86_007784 [Hymenochirus boettgeri]|uniref:Histo-blood group ABO system transferase-like n=1 Tax=Hymenochirus boettgeri TaxID=247094 RepID=A0A8T2J0I6_9PIPI|nr:hypothetical protein GDO86_007784 [Hymenochirus boettgeri]